MRIGIMTDLEGVAGIPSFDDWCLSDSKYYEKAKMLLTEETNAAIRAFFDAGADEVFVIDGHGPGAIDTILLDERAQYSRGWAVHHQFGLNENLDAIAWVGQHAKAGTVLSHMTHTGYWDVYESRINGISVGEYGECAMIAGFYGTPAIFVSGERAFIKEAKELTPWVHGVEVKRGVTLDNGSHCDADEYRVHNLGAVHVSPKVARERIYAGAKCAMEDFLANPEKFKAFCPKPPFVYETWFRKFGNVPARLEIRRHESDIVAMYSALKEVIPEGEYELPY